MYITDTVDTLRHKGKAEDVMVTVFEDGKLLIDQNFMAVRNLASRGL